MFADQAPWREPSVRDGYRAMADEQKRPWYERRPDAAFVQRVLVVIGLVVLAYFAWQVRNAFLLAFAGVLVATILLSAADPIERLTGLARKWSLLIAGIAILAFLVGFFALIGIQAGNQASTLLEQLPKAVQTIEQRLGISLPSPEALERRLQERAQAESGRITEGFPLSTQMLSWIASWGATFLEMLTGFILVVIAGIFFSADPATYRKGIVQLFPQSQHERVDETLIVCGRSLRLWLIAQLIAMTLVGVLVGLGTWVIGLPGPLALGVFAGLAEFIPVIGPILGAVPALIFAATQDLSTFVWTVLLFVAIQQLESNIITPVVQRRVASIPPALSLFAVFAFSLLFGVLGLILAAPLTVLAFVAVKKLYVRETLGEPTAVPGEKPESF